MLLECKTQGQLASVLAHELGHILCGHSLEEETRRMFSRYIDNCNTGYKDKYQLYRSHEYEADYACLVILAAAGFDPECQMGIMRELADAEAKGGKKDEVGEKNTHPSVSLIF
jgi:predicted Zn-dependent protease